MKITTTTTPPTEIDANALVVGLYADGEMTAAARAIDEASGGAIARLVECGEATGKKNERVSLLAPAGVKTPHVLLLGLGAREKMNRETAFRAAAAAARHLADKQRPRAAFCLGDDWSGEQLEAAVCGAMVGCVGQDLYRAEKNRHPFEEIIWAGGESAALESGRVLGECVNVTRRLVNEPPSQLNPAAFAEEAQRLASELKLKCEVWDKPRLEQERCGSLLAVARGSAQPPRLVIVEYWGGGKDDAPLALVGKGVTFDSGGLSIKPSDGMKTMKCDMAGAATVLGAVCAIARLKLPLNVIGLMGLVENMIGGDSYKLGDVLTTRSGKTIEVLNTDAEGRLVLADVLNVAVERKPARMIDLATLTGSCMVALGTDVAGLMSNDQIWCDEVAAAARDCGELVWQLPMYDFYGEQIKSSTADIKNIGDGRWGGAITAAKLLEEFVDDVPWTHIDIAGPAFLESSKPWLDGGGTGVMVRTLVETARRFKVKASE